MLKVNTKSLKFPIDTLKGNTNWVKRLATRITAVMILNHTSESYQVDGPVNWLYDYKNNECPLYNGAADIQASKYHLAHWVLYVGGYNCCIADLHELTGYKNEGNTRS